MLQTSAKGNKIFNAQENQHWDRLILLINDIFMALLKNASFNSLRNNTAFDEV